MSALSPAKPAPSQTLLVPIDAIDVKPQVRTHFEKDALADLAESVKANGILQPLLLRPAKKAGRFELIAGERRLRAARAAGLTHVPALAGDADDQAAMRMQIAENLDREELSVEEVAKVVRQLYDAEGDIGKVAALVKRSKPWVSKHLAVTMRWDYRPRQLLEQGKCEDLELLGAYSQWLGVIGYGHWDEIERVHKLVGTGKVTRVEMRAMVAEAKRKAQAKAEAQAREQKKATSAKAKPKRFNPKTAVRDLFRRATGWISMDGEPELSPVDDARFWEPAQRPALLDVLRAAYDEGAADAAKHGDAYKAVLAKFYTRSYMEGHEHAAWIAGAFGRPLELATLLEDVMATNRRPVEELLDDVDPEDLEEQGA